MCVQTMEGCVACQTDSEGTMVCLRCGTGYTAVTSNGTITSCVSTKLNTGGFVALGTVLAIAFVGGGGVGLYFVLRRFIQ